MNGPCRSTLPMMAAFLAASGCGIHYQLPATRFDSPEAQGRAFAGHVAPLVVSRSHEIVAVDDFTVTPPDTSSRIAEPSFPWRFELGLGVARAVDVELRKVAGGASIAAVKVQFVGEPESDAKAGNVAVAVVGGAGGGLRAGSGENVLTGTRSEWELKSRAWEVALVAGYRIDRCSLLYGGPSFTQVEIDGTVIQPEGSTNRYRFEGEGRQAAFDVGVQFKCSVLAVKLDVAAARIDYHGDERTTLSAGALVGFDW